MSSGDLSGLVAQHARAIRAVAERLAEHGVGERWQGPAQRQCENNLLALEANLKTLARHVEDAAHQANARTVMARLS